MVRQEERPWQGQMTVLLDLRSAGHVDGPTTAATDADERLKSSLEWAISAAATIGSYGIVNGREVGLVADPAVPSRLPMLDTAQIADYLSTARASSRPNLDSFEGLLGPLARESTMVAILGDLDARTLRQLAGVHPRGTSATALALLLDTATWARGPGSRQSPAGSPVQNAAHVLRAAGWQTLVVRCGEGVATSLQSLLTSRATGSYIGAGGRR
jgi:uncharacterized protein (DUF58 family)